ncbi:CoA transferase [Streptomyces sp. AM6-12]|uniref:CoA transferase n=1 Tax=Streptomyces sp. AM6-12 TaxID=3345149 RepID=UPI00378BC22D
MRSLDHNVAPSWFTIPFNPLPLLLSFVTGVAAALAGSAATLVRVSVIRPIEVLRESVVERRVMTPIRWLLGIGMLIGAVVAGTVIARSEPYLAASAREYEVVPVLYVGAVTLLAPILLRPITRLLIGPLRGSAKAGPLLVRENTLTSRRRTAATVAPIVVAVGLVATLLTMQAVSSMPDLYRRAFGTPRFSPPVLADKICGLVIVGSVLAALHSQAVTGEGERVDVPMADTMLAFNLVEHLGGKSFDPPVGEIGWSRTLVPNRGPHQAADGWICDARHRQELGRLLPCRRKA